MSIVFQQGSTIILTNGVTSRELLVSSLSMSQTFQEEEREVKTIGSPTQVADTYTNSKTQTSLGFEFYLTASDSLVLEWFGFSSAGGNKYVLSTQQQAEVNTNYSVYLKTPSGVFYRVSNVACMNLSFDFNKATALKVTIDATGSKLEQVATIVAPALTKQSYSGFLLGPLTLAGYNNLAGFTLEMTKDVTWLSRKTVGDAISGSIYYPTKALLERLSVSGSITNYKRDDTLAYTENTALTLNYADLVTFNLDQCKILDRWDIAEIHMQVRDYKVLPTASNIFIQF